MLSEKYSRNGRSMSYSLVYGMATCKQCGLASGWIIVNYLLSFQWMKLCIKHDSESTVFMDCQKSYENVSSEFLISFITYVITKPVSKERHGEWAQPFRKEVSNKSTFRISW